MFRFPLYNQKKLKKWLANMKWKDWTPTRSSVLCINHFEEQYIDRTGKCVTLREDAVPTIFTSPGRTKKKTSTKLDRKHLQTPTAKATEKESAESAAPSPATTNISVQNTEPVQTEQEPPGDLRKCDKWRIIIDEALMKIDSFPRFFHGDYCIPQNIHWAPDDNAGTENKNSENLIEVEEAWQWLGLDVRGPLPQTLNGHRYVMTVTDFYSRWVEAAPMSSCLPSDVAKNIMDIIAHFGYPLRILSRLPHDVVHKINRELKDQLNVSVTLVVHHQQTGAADWATAQLIDRMVSDLMEEHPTDWDVYLPAKVFSLCFTENSETRERPFSLLCCKGPEPVQSPRALHYTHSQIRESTFLVR
ncbi:uncharacterized protein KZ484_005417 isoform 2-T2 [Pholidichthys leucotaenia]